VKFYLNERTFHQVMPKYCIQWSATVVMEIALSQFKNFLM